MGRAVFLRRTIVGLGILGLAQGDFTAAMDGGCQGVFPRVRSLAYLCAVISLVSGNRPTLAAHSRRRLPLAAQLFLGLAAAV